jgi:hypothetical protein
MLAVPLFQFWLLFFNGNWLTEFLYFSSLFVSTLLTTLCVFFVWWTISHDTYYLNSELYVSKNSAQPSVGPFTSNKSSPSLTSDKNHNPPKSKTEHKSEKVSSLVKSKSVLASNNETKNNNNNDNINSNNSHHSLYTKQSKKPHNKFKNRSHQNILRESQLNQ